MAALAGVAIFPVLVTVGASPLAALALAILLPVITPALVARCALRGTGISWPAPPPPHDAVAPPVLRAGLIIFVSQVSAIAVFQTDVIIVSAWGGPMAAGRYEVCARLMSLPVMLQGMLLGALWPAFAQGWAAGDLAWVRKTYRRALLLTLCILLPLVFLLAGASKKIIPLWTGNSAFDPDQRLIWCYALFVGSSLWAGLHATALNAIGSIKLPALIAATQGVLNLVAVLSVLSRGVWAIALASGIVALVVNGAPLYLAWNQASRERVRSPA
jgi:O-antigen/teichoic acid export membrane protein